jgi:tRNA(fMet)-specific endonuclease VapC
VPRILLDTSGYSAFLRGHPEIGREVQEAQEIVVTPIVLGELLSGFLRGNRAAKNRKELETFLSSDRVRVVEVDLETSERYAVILDGLRMAGTPISTNDIWIAASAMQHGLRIVATDGHYRKVPQVVAACFEP